MKNQPAQTGHDRSYRDPAEPIPPLTADIAFEYVFGHEESTGILRSLLSATEDPVQRMTDDLLIHTIELPKRKRYLSTALGRWSYVLGRERTHDMYEDKAILDILKESPDIREAEERYRRFLADPQLQSLYRAREKGRYVQAARLHEARQAGLEEGIEKGRRATTEETARRLKEMGAEVSFIARATGLTEEEIAGL